MSAANKARGTTHERLVCDYLQSQSINAKRLPRTGVKDIGDAAFPLKAGGVVVVEAKNRKAMDLPTWIAESEDEARHYEEKYPLEGPAVPIVVHKRRGKGVHQSYVTMSLDTLVDLLRQVGAV